MKLRNPFDFYWRGMHNTMFVRVDANFVELYLNKWCVCYIYCDNRRRWLFWRVLWARLRFVRACNKHRYCLSEGPEHVRNFVTRVAAEVRDTVNGGLMRRLATMRQDDFYKKVSAHFATAIASEKDPFIREALQNAKVIITETI